MTAQIESVADVLSEQERRIYNLEQQISNPGVVHQNEFESIIIGSGGSEKTISMEVTEPSNLAVSPGALYNDTFVDISWDAPADGNAAQYDVHLIKEVGGVWEIAEARRVGGTSTRISGLQPGYTYGVRVYSANSIGVTSDPIPAAGYLTFVAEEDATVPDVPSTLSVTAGLRSIIATWQEVDDEDVKGGVGQYEIQIDNTGNFDDALGSEFRSELTTATIVGFSDLTPFTTYYVRIRAIDTSGNPGGWSPVGSATTAQVGSTDIEDDAVVAGKIAANEIVSGHISTVGLDAAVVKFGEMEGDRIKVNTLSAQALKASTLDVTLGINAGSIYVGDAIGVASNTGVYLDNEGIRLFKNGTLTAHLDAATGDATFTGVVSGSTITGSTVTGGLIRTSDSGGRLEIKQSGTRGYIEFFTSRTDTDGIPAYVAPNWISGSGSGFVGFGEGIKIQPPGSNAQTFGTPLYIQMYGYDSGDAANPDKALMEFWGPKFTFYGGNGAYTNTLQITRKRLETFSTDTHFEHVGTAYIRRMKVPLIFETVGSFEIRNGTWGPMIGAHSMLTNIEFLRDGTTDILRLNSNDYVEAPPVYNSTSSFTTWVVVGPDGRLYRNSSTLRDKPGWEWKRDLVDVELPDPITWEDGVSGKRYVGFGAEHVRELFELGAPDLDEGGEPVNVDLRALVAVLSEKVKRLEQRVLEGV